MVAPWQVAARFVLGGRVLSVEPCERGNINDTYFVTTDRPGRAVLQRINTQVFPRPALIMENLRTLLEHARGRQAGLRLPDIHRTAEGRDHYRDPEAGFWRALSFIPGTRTIRAIASLEQARQVGRALGRFHALASDLPPRRLHDSLPGFHITPRYLDELTRALASGRPAAMSPELRFCLSFVEAHRAGADVLEQAKAAGLLALRVIHGDPKTDNVLFDQATDRAVALVDLDTVQPGLPHYDLGDCLRSCCNTTGECPGDGEAARFDLDIARAVLQGYFPEARRFLTADDLDYVYEAIRLIPFELGLRFLTDHLLGNRYFKVSAPDQNLQRAITQFQLTASVERDAARIRRLVAELSRPQGGEPGDRQ